MASKIQRTRPRTSVATRVAAGAGLVGAVRYFGPTYSVKGSWEGTLKDLRNLPAGLEPNSVSGASFQGQKYGFSLEDGLVAMNYADGPFSLDVDGKYGWQANFTREGDQIRFAGKGTETLEWAASKKGYVKSLGDIELDINSDGNIEVGLTPTQWALQNVSLQGQTHSSPAGIAGSLAARTNGKLYDVNYRVENDAGEYDPTNLKHVLTGEAKVAGGKASAAYTYGDAGHNYNATFARAVAGGSALLQYADGANNRSYNLTFTRGLKDKLNSTHDVTLGVDEDGAYAAFTSSRAVADLTATVDVSTRGKLVGNKTDISHAEVLKLAHKFGVLSISSEDAGDVDLDGDFVFEQDGNKLAAKVGYTVGTSLVNDTSYNVTLSSDLAKFLKTAADLEVGLDNDGVYGRAAASKKLGLGFDLELASAGRKKDLEHSLKLSHELGYAELVKKQDDEARLRLGYDFEI
eukprot:TRINITY_DN854_c0_g2_i1.p1 TRINITY_DN854_c0_g2~~TRINITY_DN854_c0_g2_i1.p1  ORF type:complete len:462 (-),score=120.69 TRINITY_DN854_c0_g2_i1:344-1729(-)